VLSLINMRLLQHVVLKKPFLSLAGYRYFTKAVLHALEPFTEVRAAVCPIHLAVAVTQVCLELALVVIATLPNKNPKPRLFVICKAALVTRTALTQFAFAAPDVLLETPCVNSSTFVLQLTVALLQPHVEGSYVFVAVRESQDAFAVLESSAPLALVAILVGPDVDALSMRFGSQPLANIAVIVKPPPDSEPLFESLAPLSIVHLASMPLINALAVRPSFTKVPEVIVSICKQFKPFA
jgi:hypothetical protein